jgi:hypothetical protein
VHDPAAQPEGMMERINMEINRASTLAKVLARDRALDARERKDTAIEKGRLGDNDAYPGSKNFQQAVGVISQYLADLAEAKISSIRDAYTQTNTSLTGETVDDAIQAIRTSLETVISARIGAWRGSLALVQQRMGQTVTGGAEALAEAERELKRRAGKLYEKAEAKLDVLLQSSLAASERNDVVESRNSAEVSPLFDVFISHATEDKPYVEPLVKALEAAGIKVWFDKTALEWGDDLRPSIDLGLANCRYGIVIFSKAFLRKKKWTEYELNSLFALEQPGRKMVLPIWHGITREDVLEYGAGFADRLAKVSSKDSYEDIVESLLALLGRPTPSAVRSATPSHGVGQAQSKPNAIAYAWYETTGENAAKAKAFIRPSTQHDGWFSFENSFGEEIHKTKEEIVMKFAAFDKSLVLKHYVRMQHTASNPAFNLG